MRAVAITCIRDEGPWLLDWIAHHRAHGFTDFLIASHDCADGTDALLDALDADGIITHLPFTPKGNKAVQWQALKLLQSHALYTSAEAAMFFDVDEYLVLRKGKALVDLFVEGAQAVPLRWHLFGSSGHATWEDRPVTERFTRSAPDGAALPAGHMFKTLHHPAAFNGLGVHRPKGRAQWHFASGKRAPKVFEEKQAIIHLLGVPQKDEIAWLNHYAVRSIEEFVLKSARGLPNHTTRRVDVGYWVERNFNTVEDKRIAWMAEATAQSRADLAPYDALHEACVKHHKNHLVRLKKDKDVVDMMWRLEMVPTSYPPRAERFAAHVAMLKGLAAQEDNDG
ncbi:glycosyltransferase family 2 protein [Celeribacter sp.]|uniref:glycosyltransferase family 2 protein n=1 Tax=Celeribacter sp. TaxID=1890673 RepID=UPI003A95A047